MKRLAIIALMLNVGVAATYAQQHGAKTALSGTAAASTIPSATAHPPLNTIWRETAAWARSRFAR